MCSQQTRILFVDGKPFQQSSLFFINGPYRRVNQKSCIFHMDLQVIQHRRSGEKNENMQDFLRSKQRKSCKCQKGCMCRFSSAHSGGKVANATLSLLGAMNSLQFYPTPSRCYFSLLFYLGAVGHLPYAFYFCTRCMLHHCGAQLMTNQNGLHIEDAPKFG